MKNTLRLFATHVAPSDSDVIGTATSTDPTLLIEASFGLDAVLPLFNFYDNGRAQDLLAILLAKAAELATAAGGVLTNDLATAVAAAQAVVIDPASPVEPFSPVFVTDPAASDLSAPVVAGTPSSIHAVPAGPVFPTSILAAD